MESLEGTFWQIDTPDRRSPGWLNTAGDDRPTLKTQGPIFTERKFTVTRSPFGGITIAHSGDPEDLVADFRQRVIHGELADGTSVTIVDAQGGSENFGLFDNPLDRTQQFGARHVVMGEHLTADQLFHAIRFQVFGPTWYGTEEDNAQTADDGALLMYRDSEGARWFEFTSAAPMTFSNMDSGVINAVTTLTQLATHNDAVEAHIEVRVEPGSPWRDVHRGRKLASAGSHPLLTADHLTAERYATWIDFRRETQGLAVLDELPGVAIQTQVLTLGSVAEGLHRRLFEDKKRVIALPERKIAKMRRAAREAALALMSDSEFTDEDRIEFGKAISEAFGHINEQSFHSRMCDLLTDARRTIPSLGAAFANWPDAVSRARNLMAHQPSLPDNVDETEFLDLLIALSYSIAWVLRTNMLNKAGFDAQTMQEGYDNSSAYGHHLANTRTLLADGPWAAEAN